MFKEDDIARIIAGLTVLLLPVMGVFTIIPLAVIHYLLPPTRTLSISLALLLLLRFSLGFTGLDLPLYVVAIAFMIPTFALVASRRFDGLNGSMIYITTTIALGYPVAIMTSPELLSEKVLLLSILGGLSGAFLHHVSKERDFIVPFGTCMVMWLFSFDYPLPELSWIILLYSFAMALGLGAYWARAADVDAVISEVIICILVVLFAGLSWFLLLLCFYLMGGAFTHYKFARKRELGIAQSRGGVRGYKNVYSNSLVPLAMAICYGIYGSELFLYAFLGSVATANGDTLASEIGQTSNSGPRLITTLKPVAPGVDGGVTYLGEGAAVLGSVVIGILALATGITGTVGILVSLLGGFLGTNFDSLLGATLQQRGVLSNNGVNLLATLFGGVAGGLIWVALWR